MRYKGQSHEITTKQPAGGDWEEAFHINHQRLYGYIHEGQSVEVVTLRLRAIGESTKPRFDPQPLEGQDSQTAVISETMVWFNPDKPTLTILYSRERLKAGNRIEGPAIIIQTDTTILITPAWTAEVDQWENLQLKRTSTTN